MPRHKYGQSELESTQPSSPSNPLQQRIESKTTDLEAQTGFSEESSLEHSKPIKQQSRAIQARWAAEHATEESLRDHFQTIPLDRALALLGQMRHNCELAGQILNGRINVPEEQKCETCKKTYDSLVKSGMRDWFLNQPFFDREDRNIIHVRHFCSSACISLYNNKTQGVRAVADRGMLAQDSNFPRKK